MRHAPHLDSNGHASQRQLLARRQPSVHLCRLRQRALLIHHNEALHCRLHRAQATQVGLRQLGGAAGARRNLLPRHVQRGAPHCEARHCAGQRAGSWAALGWERWSGVAGRRRRRRRLWQPCAMGGSAGLRRLLVERESKAWRRKDWGPCALSLAERWACCCSQAKRNRAVEGKARQARLWKQRHASSPGKALQVLSTRAPAGTHH